MPAFSPVQSVAVSLSDSFIAAGYENGDLKLWSPTSGELIEDTTLPEKRINSVAVDNDSEKLLINTRENVISIWDLRMWEELG